MRANPDRCQCIVFGKEHESNESIAITDKTTLIPLDSCKLLGVEVDRKLMFKTHIAAICCKAGKQINALARLTKHLTSEVKLSMFQTFIMSHFNVCPLVWHFCGVKDLKKIEKIQHRALRYVYNDFTSSYASLRGRANRPLMYIRLKQMIIEVHKIYHNIGQLIWLIYKKVEHLYQSRNVKSLKQPRFNIVTYGQDSFSYQGAKEWNI